MEPVNDRKHKIIRIALILGVIIILLVMAYLGHIIEGIVIK